MVTPEEKAAFIESYRQYYGKSPTAKQLQEFDKSGGKISQMSKQKSKVIETVKKGNIYLPVPVSPASTQKESTFGKSSESRALIPVEGMHTPKKPSFFGRQKSRISSWGGRRKEGAGDKWNKFKGKSNVAWKHKGQAVNYGIGAVHKGAETTARFGYALPSPFQIWTLAWQKMSNALKLVTILAFALAILFIPWGVFYYVGWAVAAAFMFLVSLIFWVFTSLFNGIAYVLVTIINAATSIVMGVIVWLVQAVFNALGLGVWTNGQTLMQTSLLEYSQIANIPSLYTIVTPSWQPWMNDPLIGHLFKMAGISFDFSWLFTPFKNFYSALPPEQAVVLGLTIIAVPIIFLVYVYYKNRHHINPSY